MITKEQAINRAAEMLAIAAVQSTDADGKPIYIKVAPEYALELANIAVERLVAVG